MRRTVLYFVSLGVLATATVAARRALPVEWIQAHPDAITAPMRLASLSPSTTELCAALGLIDRLVARSSYCDWPPEVTAVPAVGALLDPDRERLMALRPDLVLLPGHSRMLQEAVANTGLRVVSMPDSTLDDVYESLRRLGQLTGHEAQATSRIAEIRNNLIDLSGQSRPRQKLRVLLVVSESRIPPVPPYVAGPGSYLDELLHMAGHENAMASLGRGWAQVGLEDVVRADPDAIVEFWPAAPADARQRAIQAWTLVGARTAVTTGRVHVVSGKNHYVPGPRVAETLREMIWLLSN